MKSLLSILLLAPLFASSPNILLILVDDMGYGDAGCFNPDSKIPTPHLDKLAAEGMRFTDAHAPGPLCHVSRYGLLTGRYPWRKEIRWNNNAVIDEDRMTIASFLQQQGYHTSMVGKWHLGFFEDKEFKGPLRGGPADRGFHDYFGIRASTDIPPYFYIRGTRAVLPPTLHIEAKNTEGWANIQGEFSRAGGISPDLKLEEVLPRFTQEAKGAILRHTTAAYEKPLFLYLAYPAPHTPWLPTKEFEGTTEVDLYGDFMTMVDANIGEVIDYLDQQGMKENTLVIFTSDNGPVWYPVDTEKYGHASCGPLRGMKADAWEGGHRMPFIVRWPNGVKANTISDRTICFTDVFATLADLHDQEIPEGQAPDSFSFLQTLQGKDQPQRKPIVMKAGGNHHLIRDGKWKLITGPGPGGFSNRYAKPSLDAPPMQLYNLAEDLGEQQNLFQTHPMIVEQLASKLKKIQAGEQTP